MPKAEFPILQFDGGENSDADPRDLGQGEVAELRGFFTDRKGMLRPAGGMVSESSVLASRLGGLLSIDLDNGTSAVLCHDGSAVSNAPATLSLSTDRPVLSFFDGGIHIADGTLGNGGAKRMYFRAQDRRGLPSGALTAGQWVSVVVSDEDAHPMDATTATVAVSSDEAGRATSTGTPDTAAYEIGAGPDQVIVFSNLASFSIDVFIFYTNNATITVEDMIGSGRVLVHIPWNGSTTPSAATLVNAINTQSSLVSAALGAQGSLYTGSGPYVLVEADIAVDPAGTTTSGTTDNFDNGKGTFWYYSNPALGNFRMRNRGPEGRTFGTVTPNAPSVGVSGNDFTISNAPDHSKGDILEFIPNASGCVAIHFTSEKDEDAVLPTTTVQFAISYVWHGYFDTPPVAQGLGIKLYGGYGYNAEALINHASIPDGVDIVRVWARDGDRSDWLLFCEFDLRKGYRFFSQADFQSLATTTITNVAKAGPVRVNEFGSASYRSVNGYDPKDAIGASYRAAAFAAGRMFAFAVRQAGVVDGDRVLVSPAGKPGLLPERNFIVFSTEDGDQYNVAEALGDRIMAFKNRKAYVVDVSGNEPSTYYVAGEFDGLGIADRNQLARSDMGLFFINKNGMFVWDGNSKPASLTQGRIERWWRANYPADSKVSVGFSPLARKVIAVLDDATVVYDLNSQGFSIIAHAALGTMLSNMQWTGSELVMGRSGATGYKYSDVGVARAGAVLRTMFMTNNAPGSRKKLKRIQVTFNRALAAGEAAKLQLLYTLDSKSETVVEGTSLVQMTVGTGISAYQHVISPSLTCYAVQVGLRSKGSEVWPADLDILDISLIYKPKRPK